MQAYQGTGLDSKCESGHRKLRQHAGELPPEDDDPGGGQDEVILPPYPCYPVDALCGPLAELVDASTLPAALVAGAGLGALAGLCPNAELEMFGSCQRPILWIPLLAPSGGAKSPSMELAFQPAERAGRGAAGAVPAGLRRLADPTQAAAGA